MYTKYETLRDKKGVKDAEVAQATGIAPATLSDWKANRYAPKADKLLKLAEYFGVSIEYFLKEDA